MSARQSTRIPAPRSARPVSTKEKTSAPNKAPSYRHVEKQTTPQDASSDHESDVASELSADDDDVNQPIPVTAAKGKTTATQPGGKGTRTNKHKEAEAASQIEKKVPVGYLLLRPAYKIGKDKVTQPDRSSFVPTAHMLDEILHAMHLCTGENTYVYRANPQYHILLSRLYYAILFHYQVLRCKRAAGAATTKEKTFMNSFEDEYPLESLPCAGPLVTYFSSLIAYKPDDPMYNWVHPTLPTPPGRAVNSDMFSADKREIRLPFIAGLLSAIALMKAGKATTSSKTVNYIDDDTDTWYPLHLKKNTIPDAATTFAGITFPAPAADGSTKLTWNHYLAVQRPGLSYPPEMSPEFIEQRRTYLKRMNTLPKPDVDDVYPDVPSTLYLNEGMEWFSYCVSAATTEANFFLGSENFSNIPFVGGPSVTVITTMSAHPTAHRSADATRQGFYTRNLFNTVGTIATRIGNISEDDLAIGQFCQFHTTLPSNAPSVAASMHSSRINDSGDYAPFYKDYLVQIESTKAGSMSNELENTVRTEIFVAKGIENRAK